MRIFRGGRRAAFSRRHAGVVFVALVAAALALGGSTAAGSRGQGPPPGKGNSQGSGWAHWTGPKGRYGNYGKLPARSGTAPGAAAVDNLTNPDNNPIMPTTNTHLIFWLPAGNHFSGGTDASDTAYENAMIKYFQDVGGSQILNTTTQYCGNNGCPADTSTYKDMIVDTTAFPHAGTAADPITQTDIFKEVGTQINNKGWPLGLSDMYFVFMPSGFVDCFDDKTTCNTNSYCAYHSYAYKNGEDKPENDYIYGVIEDNRSPNQIAAGCGDSNVTGDEAADTTLSSVEHEQMEAITDPLGNAWQDSQKNKGENGDKCNREMGVADADSTTPNNYLGAGAADKFRIQREWSNAAGGGGCAASYTTGGSHVESPAPAAGDVTLAVAEATIPGNTSDTLDYTLTFRNPSDQDDAYAVTVTDTLPSGVQFNGSGTVTLGPVNLAPHQSKTWTIAAHPSVPLQDGATLTNTAVFAFNDSTGAAQPTITRTVSSKVVNTPPVLGTLSDQTVDYHDPLSFAVSATDVDAGDSLSFSASGLPDGIALVDNGNRTATISGTDKAVPGDYTVTVRVDDHHHDASPVQGTLTIHVVREETSLAYTGQVVILVGPSGATLSAHLQEDGSGDDDGDNLAAAPDAGRVVTLGLGGQSCLASTDANGDASCTIPSSQLVLVGLGPQTITATFAGDSRYKGSSATASAIVFAFPSRGDFALGDRTVATAGPSTTVTWWGDMWNQLNVVSGGQAPSSFKGFAGSIATLPTGGAQPSACNGTWVTTGGNSPPPTSGVPSYMGVLVTANVGKSGSAIKGDFVHIVVVRVNPGYAPTPDRPGTGTIVATYC